MESLKGILIDSDILIDYLRGFEAARNFLESSERRFTLYVSVVSLAELYSGSNTVKPEIARAIEALLSHFEIALLTPRMAKQAGFLRRDYRRPFADMLIAATALEYGFGLATRNLKDFKNISELKLLKTY